MQNSIKRIFKFIAESLVIIAITLVIIIITEVSLRIAGYGYSPDFLIKHKKNGVDYYTNNIFFTSRFYTPELIRTPMPFDVPEKKPVNTFRIIIAGESAALGDPDYSFGFGRILKIMLEDDFPEMRFEIINTSITAVNSNVILPIIRETASKLKPDLFLVYMGNNEIIGPYGPNSEFASYLSKRSLIKLNMALNSLRIGQLVKNIRSKISGTEIPDSWGGMKMFLKYKIHHGEQRLETVHSTFRKNLEEIVKEASPDSKIIMSTVAVNLRDCPPFYSISDTESGKVQQRENPPSRNMNDAQTAIPDKEISQSETAKEIVARAFLLLEKGKISESGLLLENLIRNEPYYADANYLLAEVFLNLGDTTKAKGYYQNALAYDALKFRADQDINRIIEQVYKNNRDQSAVSFIDAASILNESAPCQLAGSDLFLEHVHFNFSGNYLIAQNFRIKIEEVLGLKPKLSASNSIDYFKERLAFTPYEEYKIYQELLQRLDKSPFNYQLYNEKQKSETLKTIGEIRKTVPDENVYLKALRRDPDDWIIKYNYALFFLAQGICDDRVIELLEAVKESVPQNAAVDYNMGFAFERRAEYEKALKSYEAALQTFPFYADAKRNAAALMLVSGDEDFEKKLPSPRLKKEDLAFVYNKAGKFFLKKGKEETARKYLTMCSQLVPNDRENAEILSGILIENKRYNEAIVILKNCLRSDSSDLNILVKLGYCCQSAQLADEALKFYLAGYRIDSANYMLLNRIGQVYYMKKEYDNAIVFLMRSLNAPKAEKLEYTYANIAGCYHKRGEILKAAEFYKKALLLVPDNKDLVNKLREVQQQSKL